jgi:hypothetical protein
MAKDHPSKMCECGCGQLTKIAALSSARDRTVKGSPLRFIKGHNGRVRPRASLEERFWAKVDKRRPEDCWLWNGARSRRALKGDDFCGSISVNGRMEAAPRVSFEMHNGTIPPGMYVCHHCDNPPCVNPAHLFLGTPLDNVRDKLKKGRQRYCPAIGEKCGTSKLTESQVLSAVAKRRSGTSPRRIAKELGVSEWAIYDILSGRNWGHLTGIDRAH